VLLPIKNDDALSVTIIGTEPEERHHVELYTILSARVKLAKLFPASFYHAY
jgi:hypothetical protein